MEMKLHYDKNMTIEEGRQFSNKVGIYPNYQTITVRVLNISKTLNNNDYIGAVNVLNKAIEEGAIIFGEFYTKQIKASPARFTTTSAANSAFLLRGMEFSVDTKEFAADVIPTPKMMEFIEKAIPMNFAIRAFLNPDDPGSLRIITVDVYPDYTK